MKTPYLLFFISIGFASSQDQCPHKYLVEKLGYSKDFGPLLTPDGYTAHSSHVTVKCGKESHGFECNNGTFQPTDPSKPKCRDCDPAIPRYEVQLKYSANSVDGKYAEGTTVTGTCDGNLGIVNGTSTAVCSDGKWTPELGRCPYRCILDLCKKKGYHTAYVEDSLMKRSSGYLQGAVAWAGCHNVLFGYTWYYWLCVDGGWQPSQAHYNGC